ncbi:MAG: hypothetical protein KGK02_04585 [Rhodospirillales bacterium]|nr:hypothetical protein [Rhodospirillales bacterium]
MTNNLKTRLRKLESGKADDVDETFVINDLPDPGDPDGAQAIVSGHEGRVFIEPGIDRTHVQRAVKIAPMPAGPGFGGLLGLD